MFETLRAALTWRTRGLHTMIMTITHLPPRARAYDTTHRVTLALQENVYKDRRVRVVAGRRYAHETLLYAHCLAWATREGPRPDYARATLTTA